MRAQHPSEPRKPPAHIVQLSGLVCQSKYASVFSQEQRDIAGCEEGADVFAEDVGDGAGSKEGGRFRSSGGLKVALRYIKISAVKGGWRRPVWRR